MIEALDPIWRKCFVGWQKRMSIEDMIKVWGEVNMLGLMRHLGVAPDPEQA